MFWGHLIYGIASEGLLSLHHRLLVHCIVTVNTYRKGPDDKTVVFCRSFANTYTATYITRIKNYVKFLQKKEGKKMLHHGSVWASLNQNKRNLRKPNPNPNSECSVTVELVFIVFHNKI